MNYVYRSSELNMYNFILLIAKYLLFTFFVCIFLYQPEKIWSYMNTILNLYREVSGDLLKHCMLLEEPRVSVPDNAGQ